MTYTGHFSNPDMDIVIRLNPLILSSLFQHYVRLGYCSFLSVVILLHAAGGLPKLSFPEKIERQKTEVAAHFLGVQDVTIYELFFFCNIKKKGNYS